MRKPSQNVPAADILFEQISLRFYRSMILGKMQA